MVVLGKIPCADGRIPMTDGAGEVISVGENVDEFKVGDNVVSAFWPYWLGGEMTPATRRDIPGESIDGYAREYVCMPAHAFTKAPAGYTHVEAATLPCAGVTAWRGLVVCGHVKLGDTRADPWHGWCIDVCSAIRQGCGRPSHRYVVL